MDDKSLNLIREAIRISRPRLRCRMINQKLDRIIEVLEKLVGPE
jgi:hypothetical protein